MKKVSVVAHTHWDFEWYFTRQDARVQFAYHMDEVLAALASNQLDYYLLDGQMAIIDDYLQSDPDQSAVMRKFIKAGRLFVGPWYTQIDEMVTTGESIVRNLQQGIKLSAELGGTMPIGYLPDSFGQGQDMPKIYNGFGIDKAIFWRGMPKEKSARYFYWTSDDDSKVLVTNLRNGYPVGAELMENDNYAELLHKISSDTAVTNLALPVGGDQRPVDFNLKERIAAANAAQDEYELAESTYPEYFKSLAKETTLPTYQGEFVDPSTSKIHRGIYSSRADLKQLYDRIERLMTYEVEPLMAIAQVHGIPTKQGLVGEIWKAVARGQAHDSSGGCNSDETNRDIYHRGTVALQLGISLKAYLLRKLSSNVQADLDLFFWNAAPSSLTTVKEVKIESRLPKFALTDEQQQPVAFQVLSQRTVDWATLRHDPAEMTPDLSYETTVAVSLTIPATDWAGLKVTEIAGNFGDQATTNVIENDYYQVSADSTGITLIDKRTQTTYRDCLKLEDGGDEGDTYDYSPAYQDQLLKLAFENAQVQCQVGRTGQTMRLTGHWQLPADLAERSCQQATVAEAYELELRLTADEPLQIHLIIDNQVRDHRLRAVLSSGVQAKHSYADTSFGYLRRDVEDPHLHDWQQIGWKEEPTAIYPMLHYVNIHDQAASWTVMAKGLKEYQLIGENYQQIALTLFRSVGYLGRPDLIRRPGVASGNQFRYIPTPDSQLQQKLHFKFALQLGSTFNPADTMRAFQHYAISQPYYQNQQIDLFTTTLKYFVMQPLPYAVSSQPLVTMMNTSLVFSSLTESQDASGWLLRVYNPSKQVCTGEALFDLAQPTFVSETDFVGRLQHELGIVTQVSCETFQPGAIKTFKINKRE